MTLLLLPDLEVSVARARRRNQAAEARTGRNENRFESLDMDFFRRVHEQYRAIAHREPGRVQLLAGDEGVEAIHHRITALVAERLASHRAA
jgi:dTMP kinase